MISNIDYEKCTGCGICVDVCPLDTLRLDPFQEAIPPCQEACPAGVDTRGYIYFLKQGMIGEAVDLLRQYLPFPAITGRICYHPCESNCVRKEVDEAVSINALERFVGDYLLQGKAERILLIHAGKIAVIGSGPAGLSVAYFLGRMGYRVTIFESGSEIGGMLRREVKEQRLAGDILESQISYIRDMGVEFLTNSALGQDVTLDDLRDSRYRAVFLATGFQNSDEAPLPDEIGINQGKAGTIDTVTLETAITGVFAGGGMVLGRAPVVKVVANAKRAAVSIDRYFQSVDLKEGREQEVKRVGNLPKKGIKQMPRQEASRGSTEKIRIGFTDELAEKEAARCMSCGSKAYIAHPEDCMTCFECEIKCPCNAIDVHPFKEEVALTLPISREGDK